MNPRQSLRIMVAVLAVIACCGCGGDDPVAPPDYGSITTIVYSEHVQPILDRSCATSGCHSAADRAAGLSLATYAGVTAGSGYGEVLIAGRPERSLLTVLFDGTTLRKAHPAVGRVPSAEEVAFLKRWIDEGARDDAGAMPFAGATKKVYVPNQGEDNVSVIDIEHLVVSRVIDVGTSLTVEGPHFTTSDGRFWYVSLINAGEVWKFDAGADTLLARGTVPGAPALLALTPDGKKLYVSQFTTVFTNKLSVVNTSTMTLEKQITVWSMPHGLRMNHAGTRLYVANMMSDNVSVIDVATDSVIATIPLAWDANPFGPPKYMPMEVAVSPDDQLVAVACSETREVRMIDAAAGAVADSFAVGDQPWHLQFTRDGTFCYVTNRRGHSVSAIHLPMHHVMKTYSTPGTPALFDYPHGCDISSDGQYTFVSNENVGQRFIPRYTTDNVGNVVVIDNVLADIVKVLEVGRMPTGLSVSP